MTREKAIRNIEYGLKMETSDKTPFGQLTVVSTDALSIALAALRAQQEQENNAPLTIEELRQMDGEPVWLNIGGGVWGLVDTSDFVAWLDRGGFVNLDRLSGKVYRRKPSENKP